MAIAAPWHMSDSSDRQIVPDPAFGVWRMLSEHLVGRSFSGEFPMPEGSHCWILQGKDSEDAALVAWSDDISPDGSAILRSLLDAGPVETVDAFGNRTPIELVDGLHTIPLSDVPVFVEKVNLHLAQFRGAFSIEPSFVPAMNRVQEHQIVLRNPWKIPVSGTLRLSESPEWRLTPPIQDFTIPAGATLRLPITIVPERSILAGDKLIEAEVSLSADHDYRFKIGTSVEVGLKNIDLVASWTVRRRILAQANRTSSSRRPSSTAARRPTTSTCTCWRTASARTAGPSPRSLRARPLCAPSMCPTAWRCSPENDSRVGVSDRDGITRLNRMLRIPEFNVLAAQAGLEAD